MVSTFILSPVGTYFETQFYPILLLRPVLLLYCEQIVGLYYNFALYYYWFLTKMTPYTIIVPSMIIRHFRVNNFNFAVASEEKYKYSTL